MISRISKSRVESSISSQAHSQVTHNKQSKDKQSTISRVGSSRSSHAHSQVKSEAEFWISTNPNGDEIRCSFHVTVYFTRGFPYLLRRSSPTFHQYFTSLFHQFILPVFCSIFHQELPLSPPEEFRVVSELLPRHTQVFIALIKTQVDNGKTKANVEFVTQRVSFETL